MPLQRMLHRYRPVASSQKGLEYITITVLPIGSNSAKEFRVSQKLIIQASTYFRRPFTPNSLVSQFKHVGLVDESHREFRVLLNYLHGEGDDVLRNLRRLVRVGRSVTVLLVLSYFLGRTLGMEHVCNKLMDQILHHYDMEHAYYGDLRPKTIFQLRACKVKNFLVAQLAWILAGKGITSLCDCEEGLVECCEWSSFLVKGGEDVWKLMCRLRYYEDQKHGRVAKGDSRGMKWSPASRVIAFGIPTETNRGARRHYQHARSARRRPSRKSEESQRETVKTATTSRKTKRFGMKKFLHVSLWRIRLALSARETEAPFRTTCSQLLTSLTSRVVEPQAEDAPK